jgi:hypothetical protein
MKTLILDGSLQADPIAASLRAALTDHLRARGAQVEYVLLSE